MKSKFKVGDIVLFVRDLLYSGAQEYLVLNKKYIIYDFSGDHIHLLGIHTRTFEQEHFELYEPFTEEQKKENLNLWDLMAK